MQSANDMFGLSKLCAKYGAASVSDTLSEDDVHIYDWHLTFILEHQSLKMICCPEDLLCEHVLKGIHKQKECCDACELPCCK